MELKVGERATRSNTLTFDNVKTYAEITGGSIVVPTSELWRTAQLVVERYVDADEVDNYIERWKTEPRILVTITPDDIYTRSRHSKTMDPNFPG